MPPRASSTATLRAAAVEAGSVCACFSLRRAARAVTQLYDDALRPTGLRSTQFTLLALIIGHGSISVNELAAASVSDRTTLTRNLAVLERERLIIIRSGDDARTRIVELTVDGETIMATAMPLWRRAQATMTTRIGRDSLSSLRAQLARVVEVTAPAR